MENSLARVYIKDERTIKYYQSQLTIKQIRTLKKKKLRYNECSSVFELVKKSTLTQEDRFK